MGGARRAPVLPLVPGLLVALVFAWAAIELAAVPFFRDQLHFGALLLVILLGMTWRALLPVPGWALAGDRDGEEADPARGRWPASAYA